MLLAQVQECTDRGGICDWFLRTFDNQAFAELADTILRGLGRVALILVVAYIANKIQARVVHRIADSAKRGPSDRLRKLAPEMLDAPVSPRKNQRIDAIEDVADSVIAVGIWTLAVLVSISSLGIEIGPMLAGAGFLGVAIGFGAQDLVSDFLSGVFMLAEDQYGLGDVIDAGEASGVVEGVSLRTTSVRDVTGTLWHIPNGEIRRIGNMSQDWARALLDIGVAYDSDIDRAMEIIRGVGVDMSHDDEWSHVILAEPEVWGVEDLGADAIAIRLVVKTKPGEQFMVSRELRRRIKHALDDANFEIPFPQRTVWLRSDGAEVGA